jgi:hypothetical protein
MSRSEHSEASVHYELASSLCREFRLTHSLHTCFRQRQNLHRHTGCFKKSTATLKARIHLFRGHEQRFELS